jgi:hypothetical protein
MSTNNLQDLRNILFDTIKEVRENKIEIDKAKMVNDLAQTINAQANILIKAAETFGGVNSQGLFDTEQKKLNR